MATVFIPTQLRHLTGGLDRVTARGASVGDLVDDLERQFPGFGRAVREKDELHPSLAVSVDGEIVGGGLLEPVGAESEVHFVPALGGG